MRTAQQHQLPTSYAMPKSQMATVNGQPLPASRHEILAYVDQLLTPSEHNACDRATD